MTATVPITLSNPSSEPITITLGTNDGSADGSDYTGGPYTVVIPAGSTSGTVEIPTTEDLADEPNETFTVDVDSTTGGAVGSTANTGMVTITDDDAAPDVSIGDVTVTEGLTATVTVTLTNPSSEPITVTLGTNDGSADGGDYTGGPYTVVIPAGSISGTVETVSYTHLTLPTICSV